jgi:hypothetical protein
MRNVLPITGKSLKHKCFLLISIIIKESTWYYTKGTPHLQNLSGFLAVVKIPTPPPHIPAKQMAGSLKLLMHR